jgi:hypothetical protein
MSFAPFTSRRKCTVVFNTGEKLEGILRSTVIYMTVRKSNGEDASGVKKFMLKSHEREKQVVKKVVVTSPGRAAVAKASLELRGLELGPGDELFALTEETLAPVPVTPVAGRAGHYEVKSTLGQNVFLAARIGDTYVGGWPKEGAERNDLFREVEIHLEKIAEYYNERKLLGIMVNETGTVVRTLLSLRRQVPEWAAVASAGMHDKDGAIEHFRLSIWTWRRDPENGEMALVKRGSFCRDRVSPHAATPPAGISSGLWPVVSEGGRIVAGTATGTTEDER